MQHNYVNFKKGIVEKIVKEQKINIRNYII